MFRVATLAGAVALAVAIQAQAVEVALTITEPVGEARKAEPVSSGVCFKPGQVRDAARLALFTESGQPVPAQFTPLVRLEDGSLQWVLVDFQADVPANGSAKYVVKDSGPLAAPAQPLSAVQAGKLVTFKTGPLTIVVDASKPAFDLISSVKVDGREVLRGLGAEAMTCRDALDGNRVYHAGRPTRAEFDYNGPMRSTLMLEGPYVDAAGKEWLGYRVRISVFAGGRLVRIEHELRNSCPTEVRHVKVKDAHLRFGLVGEPTASESRTDGDWIVTGGVFAKHRLLSGYFSPGLHELSNDGGRLVLGVVPLFEGGFEPRNHKGYNNQDKGKDGKLADYNPGDTGSWWLADCTYKIDEYWLGFGAAAGEQASLAKALDSRLYALASAEHYSDCEALGFGRFGSLADEAATYARWGWKNIEAWQAALLRNEWMRPRPEYHVASDLSHNETETDDAEGCLLMALRTGGRGYFDAGLAWARYYTNNFVWRQDFPYGTKRGPGRKWAFVGRDSDSIMSWGYSYGNGRTCGCHFYGGGAMDYYVLTGEKSLLAGSIDLANYVRGKWEKSVPGKDRVGSYGTRGFGRQFMAAIRFYEITRDAGWKRMIDHMAQLALKDPSMVREDDYCFIDAPSSNAMHGKLQVTKTIARLPQLQEEMKRKGLTWDEKSCTMSDARGNTWKVYNAAGSWEQTYVQQAMHRYWRLTRDREAGEYVVRYANFFRRFCWDDHCQQVTYIAWGIHVPDRGLCLGAMAGRWDPDHKDCPGPGAVHSGWYTRFGPDVAARAFDVSGQAKFLDEAKMFWNRGSKRGYQTRSQSAADDEVGTFATHVPPKDDSMLTTGLMFHLVPRTGQGGN